MIEYPRLADPTHTYRLGEWDIRGRLYARDDREADCARWTWACSKNKENQKEESSA